MISRNGNTGSRATYASTSAKVIEKRDAAPNKIHTSGCVQGTFCPPMSRIRRKPTMAKAKDIEPRKSIRRSFAVEDVATSSFGGPSNFQATRTIAVIVSGHWI